MEDPNEARKRRLEANYWISQGDPGRFSPQANAGLQRFHDMAVGTNAALARQRAAELEMLRQQGLNAIGAEEAKARGLERQGMEAARIKGAADVQVAGIGAGSAKARFGWFDESGTYHPGSDATIATQNNQATLESARLERDARIQAARIGGDWHREAAALAAASRVDAAKTTAQGRTEAATINNQGRTERSEQRTAQQEQRDFDNWIKGVNDIRNTTLTEQEKQALRQMTPEEQKAYWMKKTGRTPSGTQATQTRTWRDRYGQR